ncbi:MAG: prepilin peptidase [Trichodesmium sp. St16_bin4-tuft]|nr:prepilin peptidase [Trichodesmium sp. St4_bin8_1]MDE5072271.1 prepilin peptidase [Trichodesmium sp. St5_bin8]MDE5091043.1 prepilin peptidase [Trichodesmium sp. St18_bin3_1_1]MDE5097602.1 prepilin peptidase [Trichodesmium sp. St16_bin4-tuft]MDE5104311.1 prepilin peptidase [Trichodesmium sp. St19_bin2]
MDLLIMWPLTLIVFPLGASIGSFLNVVIYRIPAGLSILWPPSRCPKCHSRLKATENIPIFGWLRLRGRCGHCHSPISIRYPIVELITALLFLVVFGKFGITISTLGYWFFFSWLLALSMIDLDTMTLPNPLTQSGLIVGLFFQMLTTLEENFQVNNLVNYLIIGIIGAVVGLWLFDLISIFGSIAFGQTVMGGGDAKLAAMIGAWLGWKYLLLTCFLACAMGALVGGGAIALRLLDRRQPIPFGPFLAMGAGLTVIWGDNILSTYLNLFFPGF